MQTLTKKEWIAVVIAVVVVVVFFGSKLLNQAQQTPATNQLSAVDQGLAQSAQVNTIPIATTSLDINNMNNSDQNVGGAANAGSLAIKDSVVGTGAEAKVGDLVEVNYTGKFADGKVFDSSIPRGQPIPFVLGAGQVIKGWDQGILGMKVGGKRSLIIPSSLGYGAAGYPPVIPANATLYFDVELVGVKVQ